MIHWLPAAEYAAEAERLQATLSPVSGSAAPPAPTPPCRSATPPNSAGRRTGPRPLSAISPELLLRLGVTMVESKSSGETDPTYRAGSWPEQRLMSPWRLRRLGKSVALCRIIERLMRQCGVAPLMNQYGEW